MKRSFTTLLIIVVAIVSSCKEDSIQALTVPAQQTSKSEPSSIIGRWRQTYLIRYGCADKAYNETINCATAVCDVYNFTSSTNYNIIAHGSLSYGGAYSTTNDKITLVNGESSQTFTYTLLDKTLMLVQVDSSTNCTTISIYTKE
jgi:hypothetical protein